MWLRLPEAGRIREFARKVSVLIDRRTLRAVSPSLAALALLPWLVVQVGRELEFPISTDAAMSQYSAWCIRHGIKLYKDVGAPDGPFIHYLHALMQLFVGMSDHGCRVADFWIHLLGSGAMGAVLAPRFAASRKADVVQRAAWAMVAAAIWFSWYLTWGWFNTVQRDAYYALFGYLAMVLAYASPDFAGKAGRIMAGAAGFLAGAQMFGRPFGVAYVAVVGLGLLAEPATETSRWPRAKAAAAGVMASVVAILGVLAIVGSIRGLLFWYVKYPLAVHRFIGTQPFAKLFTESYAGAASTAILAFVGIGGLVCLGALPRRTIGFALAPFLFLAAACWVGKGWVQHIEQVTAGEVVALLVVLSRLWGHRASRSGWSRAHAGAAAFVLLWVARRCHEMLIGSPFEHESPMPTEAATAEVVGRWVRDHTGPKDSLFMFHHEPHVLLAAERRPAIPYYVNAIFSVRTWLEHEPGRPMTPKQRADFDKMQDYIAGDGCGKLFADPPAAMVLVDRPPQFGPDVMADIGGLCPTFPSFVKARYTRSDVAGYPVYLRNDLVR